MPRGEQFLHKSFPEMHTSKPIEGEQKRKKQRGEKATQKPGEKIADFLEVIEKTHGHHDDPRVLERIKKDYHKRWVIKSEDVPESYFNAQKRIAREQGRGDIELDRYEREQLIEIIRADQASSLDNWVDYLSSPDAEAYPMWARYWAFRGMLKLSSYDKEKHAFGNRRKDTVAPFPDLNREALAYVVDAVSNDIEKKGISEEPQDPEFQKLLKGKCFGKLYAWAVEKATPHEGSELVQTKGEWVKYDRHSDCMPLVNSLEGHGTGWCTAGITTAETQLKSGDFYVYYSDDKSGQPNIPRAAIRMEGDQIAEVRGIAPDQNLDPYIGEVVDKKLSKFPDGEKYKKKVADMERLTEIEKRYQSDKELSKEDLRFLYGVDEPIEGFGYHKDPRIEEIIGQRDVKSDISAITGFSPDEISVSRGEALRGGKKFHYGNLDLRDFEDAKGLELPERISGDLSLSGIREAYGIKFPKKIGGDVYLGRLEKADGVKLPAEIGGFLDIMNLTKADGIEFPKKIGNDLDLSILKEGKGLKLPEEIGGRLILSCLTTAEGLKFPKEIGEDLSLSSLATAEGLKLPKKIGGDLFLGRLKKAKRLKFPEEIGGCIDLSSLTSAEGVKFPESIHDDLYLRSLTSAEGVKFPESIDGTLFLSSLRTTKGLELPKHVSAGVDLASFDDRTIDYMQGRYPNLDIS